MLQPTPLHLTVKEYVTPEKFESWKVYGESIGFSYVASGPLVKSLISFFPYMSYTNIIFALVWALLSVELGLSFELGMSLSCSIELKEKMNWHRGTVPQTGPTIKLIPNPAYSPWFNL